jgi:hypothetical protein
MDTGRIKMENYKGVLYCDAYMNDEFSLDDLAAMRAEIHKNYSSNTDVILKKVGAYSVSVQAQTTLWKGIPEFRNFVYVVDNDWKRESAEYAAMTYMRPYNARVADTREEAYDILKEIEETKA